MQGTHYPFREETPGKYKVPEGNDPTQRMAARVMRDLKVPEKRVRLPESGGPKGRTVENREKEVVKDIYRDLVVRGRRKGRGWRERTLADSERTPMPQKGGTILKRTCLLTKNVWGLTNWM